MPAPLQMWIRTLNAHLSFARKRLVYTPSPFCQQRRDISEINVLKTQRLSPRVFRRYFPGKKTNFIHISFQSFSLTCYVSAPYFHNSGGEKKRERSLHTFHGEIEIAQRRVARYCLTLALTTPCGIILRSNNPCAKRSHRPCSWENTPHCPILAPCQSESISSRKLTTSH